jgi:hypothetical protein
MVTNEKRPRWVRAVPWALGLTLGGPLLNSLAMPSCRYSGQLVALMAGCVWLFLCGWGAITQPWVISKYFGQPSMVGEMTEENTTGFVRWYFRICGVVMMLLAVLLGLAASCGLLHEGPVQLPLH